MLIAAEEGEGAAGAGVQPPQGSVVGHRHQLGRPAPAAHPPAHPCRDNYVPHTTPQSPLHPSEQPCGDWLDWEAVCTSCYTSEFDDQQVNFHTAFDQR